mmetsp:Transcript_8768/g.20991  ORF Transcript_8768/g.20991 Transcript_8768/m.20991 type:complete len:547 (+) Transcript_8768:23-1663(+)|eukprot:CAMPEP_0113633304 /NCGR_PEP_ID=MMETSP0017_2-20120614/17331_1 /TAXON_ID=2856 /ORGANISM="Cylindrotheca closterium" /LENGTH=546 /DNA_ID=CAMNT_0000543935 /DNA_START=32 /DNA_END=1672 /DNA_ORIENTATION=+ /assembly_acc=CAM_ASM_000147
MRFKFKVNLFSEEKSKHQDRDKKKGTGERADRKPSDRLIELKKNFKKSKNRKPQEEARETRYYNQRGRQEEREPHEDFRRDITPPRRTCGVVPPRVGSRRDFPTLRKNPKHVIQQKLSKKVDARLDALREQLGVEFDHEYGAQMHRVQSIDHQARGISFDRTRSAPAQRNHQTANMPFAGKAVPAPLPPQRAPSFNGQRQPAFGGNQGSSFTPYSKPPPSKMPARAQMIPIFHKKPIQRPKARSPRPVKSKSRKPSRDETAAADESGYGILGAMFNNMCTADSGCANAQSACTDAHAECTDIQAGCSSANKCADGSYFDEETLWTESETLSDTQYDGETIKSYIGENDSDGSDSEFDDDESSWGDATSYQSEDDTHHHDRRKRGASRKTDERKQGKRPSSRNTKSEKPGNKNKSRRDYDDETYAYSDGESFYTKDRTEADTHYRGEYDAESQWTDGETYFTKETRRSRQYGRGSRRRRGSDSDLTDSEADSRSSYSSYDSEDGDSYDTRTYSDSTWRTNRVDDDTYYDDETRYTEAKKRTKQKNRR